MIIPSWYPEQEQAEKITDFILWYSRYEYALKNSGYQRKGVKDLEPDWSAFINYLNSSKLPIPKPLEEALSYLKEKPVEKQLSDKVWRPVIRDSDWEWLIRSLTTVRNNLFHGGKQGESKLLDKERDRILINICQDIMQEVYKICPPEVQDFLS